MGTLDFNNRQKMSWVTRSVPLDKLRSIACAMTKDAAHESINDWLRMRMLVDFLRSVGERIITQVTTVLPNIPSKPMER